MAQLAVGRLDAACTRHRGSPDDGDDKYRGYGTINDVILRMEIEITMMIVVVIQH